MMTKVLRITRMLTKGLMRTSVAICVPNAERLGLMFVYATICVGLMGCNPGENPGGDETVINTNQPGDIEWAKGSRDSMEGTKEYYLIGKDSSGFFLASRPLSRGSAERAIVARASTIEEVREWIVDEEKFPNIGIADEFAAAVACEGGRPLSSTERAKLRE